MGFDLGAFVSGFAGVVGGGVVVGSYIRSLREEVAALRGELKTVKDNHLATIEGRVAEIEKECGARHEKLGGDLTAMVRLAEEVRNLCGWLKRIDGTLGLISERTATTSAAIDAVKVWLTNLNADYQAHQRDHSIHGGGKP